MLVINVFFKPYTSIIPLVKSFVKCPDARGVWFSAKYRGLARSSLVLFGMILVAAVSGECGHGSVLYSWVSYIVMCVRVDGRGWPNEDD